MMFGSPSSLAIIAMAVSLASVLSACGRSQQEDPTDNATKPVIEKVSSPGTTKEAITLKGVSFDKPGVKEAVKELCVLPDGWRKDSTWCTFDKNGDISLPRFKYGHLPRSILSINIARAEIREDGALVYFSMNGTKSEMIELADLLSEKYGKPLVKNDQVENQLGTKFDKMIFVWVDNQGTQLTIESIGNIKINEGSIRIESASRLAKNAEMQIKQKIEAKSNL